MCEQYANPKIKSFNSYVFVHKARPKVFFSEMWKTEDLRH